MQTIKILTITALLVWVSLLAQAQTDSRHLPAQQAAQWLKTDKNVVVLDVRTPAEFRTGHLKNAVNIDYTAPDFEQQLAKLDKAKPYLLHCAVGGRSTKALPVLQKLGFRDVRHLDGGLQAWQSAKLPVVN
ncbi:rhodanese-like domain-containing protein [Spirosoma arcticum]